MISSLAKAQATMPQAVDPQTMNQQPAGLSLPHDVQGLLDKPFNWSFLFIAIGCLLAAVAIIYFLYRVFFTKAEINSKTNYEIQLQKLGSASKLIGEDKQDLKTFYFEASMILRSVLQDCYEINLVDKTFAELQKVFDRHDPLKSASDSSSWLDFFRRSESIKFAGVAANLEDAQVDLGHVKDWVAAADPKLKQDSPSDSMSKEGGS